MVLGDDLVKVADVDAGISLRGAELAMPQQDLELADAGAPAEHVSRASVAQKMRPSPSATVRWVVFGLSAAATPAIQSRARAGSSSARRAAA